MVMKVFEDIRRFVYSEIVPLYASFDPAHREEHVQTVISQAMKLLEDRDCWLAGHPEADAIWGEALDESMLFVAAAYHDLGLVNGRERHHLDSGTIIREDERLRQWFSEEQIETVAQAAEDHRASGKTPPRTLYGMLVAEADRVIDGDTIILRTLQFGQKHYPDLDREGQIERAIEHLREKYGYGGYLRLWIPWSDNAVRLADLRKTIADELAIRGAVGRILDGMN